ncbi:MAG: 2,3-bisphosphoglycerate-independent phosphoglycerate mutase [Euryarchaeota archaeon]|nr:2,3-bisphosphoglycerate-independent phosphoglycerate mutase [Euryarchaeota archaeon]
MKALVIVGDGIADRPIPELNGKTPLEVANIPNMNKLAQMGISGLMDPVAPGIRAGSDIAHLSIFGYDPFEVYTGRGPIEAIGAGIELRQNDVAFRCNFATADNNFNLLDRTAGFIREGNEELAQALNKLQLESAKGVQLIFKVSADYRAALVLRGRGLSPKVADCYPRTGEPIKEIRPINRTKTAYKTARILNEFLKKSHEMLKAHPINQARIQEGKLPANVILIRGGGKLSKNMESFSKKYGLTGACIAGCGLIKGVFKLMGFDVIEVPGATGYIDTDVDAKGQAAVEALKNHDFAIIHVEGSDEVSHEGMLEAKIKIIERIDSMIGKILDQINLEETYVVILSDHTTPISVKDHTADPVPITICGPEVRKDGVQAFNENTVVLGGLNRIRGSDFMPILLDLMGRAKKFGA